MSHNKIHPRLSFLVPLIIAGMLGAYPAHLIAETEADELLADKANVKITMDLQDVSLRDALKMLSVQSGTNFIASEAVADRKLTLYLDNVPLIDALDKIFKVNNLSYELDKESNIFIVKDWGKPSIELDTRVYFLKYIRVANSRLNEGLAAGSSSASSSGSSGASTAAASGSLGSTTATSATSTTTANGLKDALNSVVSEYGKIIEDPATNSMIVTDMPSKFPIIEQLVAKLDVPIPQVMIEVEVLDVDKSEVDKLGVKWPQSPVQLTVPGSKATTFPFGSKGTSGQGWNIDPAAGAFGGAGSWDFAWGAAHFGPSILTIIGSTLTLDLLKRISSTKFLARPKLFVLNNETAEVRLSANEAIGSGTTTQGQGTASTTTVSAERAETGVTLMVTPQISMATGEITMILHPTIKEAVTSAITLQTGNNAAQSLKDVEERSVKSTVRVRDGQTIVLGGLIRNKNLLTKDQVSLLADIPILGMLFRHKDTSGSKDREILVFITPKIIKSSAPSARSGSFGAPKRLGERKQDELISPSAALAAGPQRREIVSQALKAYER